MSRIWRAELRALSSPLPTLKALTTAGVIPLYMMANNTLARDVAARTVIAAGMVEPPKESLLWGLRRKLEEALRLS